MARAKTTTKKHVPEQTTNRTKFQRFDVEAIPRGQIKNAPYNPRVIDPEARDRLRAKIQTVGLVTTLVWNRRTGNLVGGHQRLSILDELEGSEDYTLTVSVIDVDAREEKSLNVFLNNTATMGDWDTNALAAIAEEFKDQDATLGFAPGELDYLLKSGEQDGKDGDGQGKGQRPTQHETQVVVVCQTAAQLESFMALIRHPKSTRYVDGPKHFAKHGFKGGA